MAHASWGYACSAGGTNLYGYGQALDAAACNCGENPVTGCVSGSCTTTAAGSLANCQSPTPGFQGVVDLVCNVAEWVDACGTVNDPGACPIVGREYLRPLGSALAWGAPPNTACNQVDYGQRDGVVKNTMNDTDPKYIGFRCCSDP